MQIKIFWKSLCLKQLHVPVIVSAMAVVFFSSCSVYKTTPYFNTLRNDTTLQVLINKQGDLKIRKDDGLGISIVSANPLEDALFNGSGKGGYIVDRNGDIHIYKLGVLHVEGMTRKELKDQIQEALGAYLIEPVVEVSFTNHKITVIGSGISTSQVIEIKEEQVPLLDVLALSGDLNPSGSAQTLLVIRDSANVKEFKRINLEDHSLFTVSSPWYYLRANDVLYVESDPKKFNRSERRQSIQQTMSIVISSVSFLLIIIDRIFR